MKVALRLLGSGLVAALLATTASAAPLQWRTWNDEVFKTATAEHKLVILDLAAVWCHWCHVMDEKTYADPKIQDILNSKFVTVRVDQDSSPALSSRYGDWGWPATIIFGPDGKELVKLRGYIEPERMLAVLDATVKDPTPGPSATEGVDFAPAETSTLSKDERTKMMKAFDDNYDSDVGGWGDGYKLIDSDSMDLSLSRAESGDKRATQRARQTFDAATALIDPVWGGVYQYSVDDVWNHPHFEKIASFQTQYLRQYSQAYGLWHDPKYLAAAKKIEGYLTTTLKGEDGAFYVSQDADLSSKVDGHQYYALDDAARRKLGTPRVDTHQYARENGWAIGALVTYANMTKDETALATAQKAADWVIANRSIDGGGFSHSGEDKGGPFLGDTIAMGNAFVDLYAATGDRKWLDRASQAGDFIGKTFKSDSGGFISAKSEADVGVFKTPAKQIDDQVAVARFMNRLFRYDGVSSYDDLAKHAMRYLAGAAKQIERPLPGVLLADKEVSYAPTHITIVGHKDDAAAQSLDLAARAFPASYKRLDWWDTREGPLKNPDVSYPELDRAAAFACGNRICSLPVFTPDDLKGAVDKMNRKTVQKDAEK